MAVGLDTSVVLRLLTGQLRDKAERARAYLEEVNPSILVEGTSRSTEDYDRGEKLSHYKQLPSLQAVLIASHRRPQITLAFRGVGGWELCEFRIGEDVALAKPAIEFPVQDVYAGIELDVS